MARATTRSQKQPSQSQRQPPQSQPRQTRGSQSQRRRGRDEEEEEEEEEEQEAQDEDIEMDGVGNVKKDLDRKANDLVRLALFTEARRVPLRREEISKKAVLGSSTRAFNTVMERAQDILHKVFGMELVELQARPEPDKDANDKDAELLKGTGVKKRAAPTGTKTYILRSVLAPSIIERACAPNAEIRAAEQADRADAVAEDENDDDDDNRVGKRSTGSIFAWHAADQLGSVGMLYVILALILVEGKVISDNDLRGILKRLRLSGSAHVPLSSQSTHQALTVDAYLTQLARQGYLDRNRVGEQKGQKRGRVPAATQATQGEDGANNWEWRWGARARAEVGEKAIARFVAEFMVAKTGGDETDGEGEGEEGRARADVGEKKRFEIILRGIERAAGTALADVRS
ncbi:Melanoma-associated antigen G1 [Sparassis crispa]|uniref:Melanoma-associated antigen G1 n=1 Tax=Sparassis crispa TaxID=139825 RepID=A0A401H3B1_9APHY|nr:Melanoma-associated antigen G1 [Sparassis crispa]GBE88892.1 Melanoma-associated antigen G1 [Sparassis crispa]